MTLNVDLTSMSHSVLLVRPKQKPESTAVALLPVSRCARGRARQRLQFRQKRVGHVDALHSHALTLRMTARARQTNTFVFEHFREHRFQTLEIVLPAGERVGIDRENSMAD